MIINSLSRIISESVPYLVSRGKLEKARKIIISAAKMNKVMIDERALDSKETEEELTTDTKYSSPVAVFYAPKMARYTWIEMYIW